MKILFGDSPITMVDSLFITIVSMVIVFFVLLIISFILSLFKYIPSKEEPVKVEKMGADMLSDATMSSVKGKRLGPEEIKDEKMLVALLVSAIEAAGENQDAYIRVKSIIEIQ